MKLRPLLEERRRTVKEITAQMKQTPWKIFIYSFLIYLTAFIISLGMISLIFTIFQVSMVWLRIILAIPFTFIIAKKFVEIVDKIKEESTK